MSRDNALVANAADAKQVKHARRKEQRARERELDDLRFVLGSEQGRRFVWRLMEYCGPLVSPSHPRADMTQQNIGKGDVGRFLISEVNDADDEKWLLMQREAKARVTSEQAERVAVRTKSTTDTGDSDAQDQDS